MLNAERNRPGFSIRARRIKADALPDFMQADGKYRRREVGEKRRVRVNQAEDIVDLREASVGPQPLCDAQASGRH